MAIFLAPLQQLAFVVVVEGFQFVHIDISAQDFADDKLAGTIVATLQVDGPHEGFDGIAEHRSAEAGIVKFVEQGVEAHAIADEVKRLSLNDFGSHFSEEAFVGVGIFFEEVFRYDGAQHSVAQIFEAFVVLHGIRLIGWR